VRFQIPTELTKNITAFWDVRRVESITFTDVSEEPSRANTLLL
jgi:hypothetical protein